MHFVPIFLLMVHLALVHTIPTSDNLFAVEGTTNYGAFPFGPAPPAVKLANYAADVSNLNNGVAPASHYADLPDLNEAISPNSYPIPLKINYDFAVPEAGSNEGTLPFTDDPFRKNFASTTEESYHMKANILDENTEINIQDYKCDLSIDIIMCTASAKLDDPDFCMFIFFFAIKVISRSTFVQKKHKCAKLIFALSRTHIHSQRRHRQMQRSQKPRLLPCGTVITTTCGRQSSTRNRIN